MLNIPVLASFVIGYTTSRSNSLPISFSPTDDAREPEQRIVREKKRRLCLIGSGAISICIFRRGDTIKKGRVRQRSTAINVERTSNLLAISAPPTRSTQHGQMSREEETGLANLCVRAFVAVRKGVLRDMKVGQRKDVRDPASSLLTFARR
jgi:hypothetical protein